MTAAAMTPEDAGTPAADNEFCRASQKIFKMAKLIPLIISISYSEDDSAKKWNGRISIKNGQIKNIFTKL